MFEKGIDYYAQKELSITRRKLELEGSLAAVEAEAGAALLDAEETEVAASYAPSLDKLDRVRGELRALEAAITTCRARRLEAIKVKQATEVAGLRKQAADKTKEWGALEGKILKALAHLAEMEKCDYAPTGTPRTGILRAEIADLERAARDAEQSDIPVAGVVDLDGVVDNEQVLLAVAAYPASGPTVEQVMAWLNACEDTARKACSSSFADRPRRVRLMWDANGIDPKQSYVFCDALCKRQGDGMSIYPHSGTFRAGAVQNATGRDAQPAIESPARGGWYRA